MSALEHQKDIATPSRTNAILKKYHLTMKKSLGQNFLVEPNILTKMVAAAGIDKNTNAIEIGPGIGALTERLAREAKKVVAFEVDRRLAPILKTELAEYDNIEIIFQDILQANVPQVIEEHFKPAERLVVAANLPYYITTPILFKLFEANEEIERITVMMQKEVGERFLAHENDKEYNALSVITQYRCDVKKVMDVSRRVFWPSPNVDSMVIQFSFHHKYHLEDENYFFDLVKACFTQRRKTIYNNFQNFVKDKALAKELLEKVNIDPSTRAQQCTLEDFIRLYEVTYESTGKGKN